MKFKTGFIIKPLESLKVFNFEIEPTYSTKWFIEIQSMILFSCVLRLSLATSKLHLRMIDVLSFDEILIYIFYYCIVFHI